MLRPQIPKIPTQNSNPKTQPQIPKSQPKILTPNPDPKPPPKIPNIPTSNPQILAPNPTPQPLNSHPHGCPPVLPCHFLEAAAAVEGDVAEVQHGHAQALVFEALYFLLRPEVR